MGSFTGIGKLPSELSEKTSLSETDIVITGSAAQRTTWKNVFEKISFSGLATAAKNIIGAINELNTKIGTGLNNTDLSGRTSYPKKVGCYRVISGAVAGLPIGSLGYGTLLIVNGGGYVTHIYIDAASNMYWVRTDGFAVPTGWNSVTAISVSANS